MSESTPPPFTPNINDDDDFVMQPPQTVDNVKLIPEEEPDRQQIFSDPEDETLYTAPADDEQPLIFAEEVTEEIVTPVEIPEQPKAEEEQCPERDKPDFDSLEGKIDRLTESVDNFTAGLDEKFARATQTAELFDRMYSEMAKYKDDLYAKLLKPFILEAVTILEDYRKTLDRLDSLTLDQIKKTLRNIPADMEDLLENNGVDILISEGENPPYDRKLHQVIRTVETDNPELDGKIAKKLRPGYAWNGTILRQEKVEVYKLKK